MTNPKYKTNLVTALPYAVGLLAILVAVYLFFEMRRQNAQIAELLSRGNSAEQRKHQDPYLAGPVKNRILKGYPEIQACYKAFLESKPSKKSGKLRIDWQITTSGRAVSPEVVASEFGNATFEKCVTEKIAQWRFPEPSVQKYVEHTFRFDAKGDAAKAPPSPTPEGVE